MTLEIEPGAPLDETRLSEEYGVSRTPLRDVLRQLAGEGYVRLRDNRGAQVSPMSHKTMRDFFLTAPMIYAAVARLAAENRTEAQLEQLRTVQAAFRAATAAKGGAETVIDAMIYWNERFHFVMGQMADNPYLMPSLQRLLIDHARIGRTFWRAETKDAAARIDAAADHHDQFIALLEARDADRAVELTRAHWALSRDHLERFVRPDPLPFDAPSADPARPD